MKNMLGSVLLLSLVACSRQEIEYDSLKNCQDYTVPLFKDEYVNKSALFVFPHPDDEITCAGTIVELKKSGWKVSLLTLTQGQTPDEKSVRRSEWENATRALNLDDAEILDLVNNSWDDVLSNKINFWYDSTDSVERIIDSAIAKYQPSLVFTYDTALGAYGHPEHRMSALAAAHLLTKYKSDSAFPVQKIFQLTIPQRMEDALLGSSESYQNAIRITGNTSLPEPTVAFDITNHWTVKRIAAMQYSSQERTLKKFFLWPVEQDTGLHYQTFDREYYFELRR